MRSLKNPGLYTVFAFVVCLVVAFNPATAQTESILHVFGKGTNDGINPQGSLIADSDGALYGVTNGGGKYNRGSVFKLSPSPSGTWGQNILYSFSGADGSNPSGPLYMDPSHNLYGTTIFGGSANNGVVFELTPGKPWKEKVIHDFSGTSDGGGPATGVIPGNKGTFYGTTFGGTVFRVSAQPDGTWKETVLQSLNFLFIPLGLVRNSAGSLYGMTEGGSFGNGAVYELSPPSDGKGAWTENILYEFKGGSDGGWPVNNGSLILDNTGSLYGLTRVGGGGSCGCGTVFKLSRPAGGTGPWTKTTLYSFTAGSDGFDSSGSLLFDSTGALYGTTQYGGDDNLNGCSSNKLILGCGTVFKLTPPPGGTGPWTESTLHAFELGNDGGLPQWGLLLNNGNLYGVTYLGGSADNLGTVFEINPESR